MHPREEDSEGLPLARPGTGWFLVSPTDERARDRHDDPLWCPEPARSAARPRSAGDPRERPHPWGTDRASRCYRDSSEGPSTSGPFLPMTMSVMTGPTVPVVVALPAHTLAGASAGLDTRTPDVPLIVVAADVLEPTGLDVVLRPVGKVLRTGGTVAYWVHVNGEQVGMIGDAEAEQAGPALPWWWACWRERGDERARANSFGGDDLPSLAHALAWLLESAIGRAAATPVLGAAVARAGRRGRG